MFYDSNFMKFLQLITFGFLILIAKAEDKPAKIQGAFGVKLGETVPEDLIVSTSVNSLGFTEIKFKPKHTLDPLTEYIAAVTPEDAKIWMLIGTANMTQESDLIHYSEQFRKLVAFKYGKMTAINDNNSIESRWKYLESSTNRTISVAFKRIDEALVMTYEDLNLH